MILRPARVVPFVRRIVPALGVLVLSSSVAWAQTTPEPASGAASSATPAAGEGAAPTGIWERANLLGDIGGLRTVLGNVGVTLNLTESSEVMGNATGGLKQGATYDGLTTMTLQMDTQKAFGWEGGTFNVSGLQIHGRNLSQYYLSNLQTASGIEASPTTRFWEIWYQQAFLGGKIDAKLGLQSIDQEFITSTGSSLFVNTAMGWPLLPSYDMYAGGPAYPLSSLGVRLRGKVSDEITVLGGVFQDNPPGGPFSNDGQLRGASRFGANFNLRTGTLFIAELQYAINQPPTGDDPKPSGLPASYKIGAWYDTAGFPDARFDSTGLPITAPSSNGLPKLRSNNYSIYGVVDQGIWSPSTDSPQLVSVFARVMGAPGDRNLIDFSLNAGVTLKAPLPGRDNDTFGVAYGFGHVSNSARGADQLSALSSGTAMPVRSSESFIEVTYQAQVTPWLQVQPDFQYVFTPGGGIADPYTPGKRIANEAIFGARTNVTF